jgi:hypothetical protein
MARCEMCGRYLGRDVEQTLCVKGHDNCKLFVQSIDQTITDKNLITIFLESQGYRQQGVSVRRKLVDYSLLDTEIQTEIAMKVFRLYTRDLTYSRDISIQEWFTLLDHYSYKGEKMLMLIAKEDIIRFYNISLMFIKHDVGYTITPTQIQEIEQLMSGNLTNFLKLRNSLHMAGILEFEANHVAELLLEILSYETQDSKQIIVSSLFAENEGIGAMKHGNWIHCPEGIENPFKRLNQEILHSYPLQYLELRLSLHNNQFVEATTDEIICQLENCLKTEHTETNLEALNKILSGELEALGLDIIDQIRSNLEAGDSGIYSEIESCLERLIDSFSIVELSHNLQPNRINLRMHSEKITLKLSNSYLLQSDITRITFSNCIQFISRFGSEWDSEKVGLFFRTNPTEFAVIGYIIKFCPEKVDFIFTTILPEKDCAVREKIVKNLALNYPQSVNLLKGKVKEYVKDSHFELLSILEYYVALIRINRNPYDLDFLIKLKNETENKTALRKLKKAISYTQKPNYKCFDFLQT